MPSTCYFAGVLAASAWMVASLQINRLFILRSIQCICRSAILERCLQRLEFDKARDAEAKAQADQLEAERMAMQSIDW